MKTLTGLNAVKSIMDPIHGPIKITKIELKIISTPVFQRLRKISQLSSVSLVFPGATHNRFQHSLGTMHVMERFLYTLKHNEKISTDQGDLNKFIQIMRISALLHDCGHLPFSHTFENMYETKHMHEVIGAHIITKSEIKDILEDNIISPNLISSIIKNQVLFGDEFLDLVKITKPLLHSDADADRLDYLLRDSFFTGVPYGKIDINRIIDCVDIVEGRICFEAKALDSLENLLFSRYQMYRAVNIHKTVICFDLLLIEICKLVNQYKNLDPFLFSLPNEQDFESVTKEWYNNEFFNLNEDFFFVSVQRLLKNHKHEIDPNDYKKLWNLNERIKRRQAIPCCYIHDDLQLEGTRNYCKREERLFNDLKDNEDFINDWSFLRNDPSKPIHIATSLVKENDIDGQSSEQIVILDKNGVPKLLQTISKSVIKDLASHHRVLIAYYHNDRSVKEKIEDYASKHIESV